MPNDPVIPHPTWQTFSFLVRQALQTYYILFMFSCPYAGMAQWLALFDDVSFCTKVQILIRTFFFPPWGWICFNLPSTGCNYALLNYLPGTIIVFEALYGVILCRSTWTWRELKLYRVKYYFLMSFRLLWFLKYSQLTIWHLQCSKYI